MILPEPSLKRNESFVRRSQRKVQDLSVKRREQHQERARVRLAKRVARTRSGKDPWHLLNPHTSVWVKRLDVMTMGALTFTAIVTPYEAAFIKPASHVNAIFICNRVVDLCFLIDMIAQFFTILEVNTGLEGTQLINDQRSIARHYLCGWFPLDLLTTCLSATDFLVIGSTADDENVGGSSYRLKLLRIIRIARVVKLLRLSRCARIFDRYETRISINYAYLSLVRVTLAVIFFLHWSACLWGMQLAISTFDIELTWVGVHGYCVTEGEQVSGLAYTETPYAGYAAVDERGFRWVCRAPAAVYMGALYTCSSVSAIIASPGNTIEQIVSVLLMLAGGTLWAQVTGVFCGVLSTMNPHVTQFRITMDALNAFMHRVGFAPELQLRLREYFHKSRHVQVADANNELLLKMSPTLQGEVLWAVNSTWLRRVRFLAQCQPEFIAKVLLSLRPLVFAPSEIIFGNQLYILHHGVAVYGGKVIGSGGVWGEDMLIWQESLRSRHFAKALHYVEVFSLERNQLFDVSEHFPASRRMIRRYIAMLAFRRMVVVIAKKELAMRQELGLGSAQRSPFLQQYFAMLQQAELEAGGEANRALKQLGAAGSDADGSTASLPNGCSSVGVVPRGARPPPRASTASDQLANLAPSVAGSPTTGAQPSPPEEEPAPPSEYSRSSPDRRPVRAASAVAGLAAPGSDAQADRHRKHRHRKHLRSADEDTTSSHAARIGLMTPSVVMGSISQLHRELHEHRQHAEQQAATLNAHMAEQAAAVSSVLAQLQQLQAQVTGTGSSSAPLNHLAA